MNRNINLKNKIIPSYQKQLSKLEMKNISGADDIRKYRMERCYTQEFMANQLGITQSAYQKIENGTTKLTIERFQEILHVLNINEDTNREIDLKKQISLMQSIITQQESRINHLLIILDLKNNEIKRLINNG